MAIGRPMAPVELSEQTREQLESMTRSRSLSHGLVRRSEIVLLAADGWPNQDIAQALSVSRATSRIRFAPGAIVSLVGPQHRPFPFNRWITAYNTESPP